MTLTINKDIYYQLLSETKIIPKIIETDIEYEHYLAVSEKLIAKKDRRTPEETTLLRLSIYLLEAYEEKKFSLKDWGDIPPHEILQHLLEESGKKQSELVGIISASKGSISVIVNGKRAISKEQAKRLGKYFQVSPSLFI